MPILTLRPMLPCMMPKGETVATAQPLLKRSIAALARLISFRFVRTSELTLQYVSRRAFSSASQFVGERHVHEAVTHFCGELEYMDIIKDAELKGCVNRIMHKARDGVNHGPDC